MAKATKGKSDVLRIGLVTGGFVVNVISSTLEFAATLGYPVFGEVTPAPGGYLIGGVLYPAAPEPQDVQNGRVLEQRILEALDTLRAYANAGSPTNAQTIAAVKSLCTTVIALSRLTLKRSDDTT